jgi:hypothetical protein
MQRCETTACGNETTRRGKNDSIDRRGDGYAHARVAHLE